ncbi:MAG: hypothetical protein VXZ82_02985 [Planctomycetota bacterium]|nr:hypothetical protein [Planctomycetota bacterium]
MQQLTLFMLFSIAFTATASADDQLRPSDNDRELKKWLQNMLWHHRFSLKEIEQVTGFGEEKIQSKLKQFDIRSDNRPARPKERLLMLPYPGGRHPRIGFLEGAIEPQRETKLSVFYPWDDHSYVVLDVPEAIWSDLGLTYLAHTHIDTVWTQQRIELDKLEWKSTKDGSFEMVRRLPNGIEFGTLAIAKRDHIAMEMWLKNGTDKTLTDLRVQNCAMLKAADGFEEQTNANKVFDRGYAMANAAIPGSTKQRWIITAWDPVHRPWANDKCPCLHSDPKFEDCSPGETERLRGWFSFYEGSDIRSEIDRIEATDWRKSAIR